jgi:predicted GNAT superfamily acetyltransferase
MPDDAASARAFVSDHFAGTRYRSRVLEILECALRFDDPEYMALLAHDGAGPQLVGLALFGAVAGARSVVKVHALVGHDAPAAAALVEAIRETSEHSGERMIVCEIPDDEPFTVAAAALVSSGFTEEGRVPDFVRDGVALRLLVRPLYGG